MARPIEPDTVLNVGKELVRERDELYGEAYVTTGLVVRELRNPIEKLLMYWPGLYLPWLMILNKLMRALANPGYPDTWRDIAGYAQLALEHINKEAPIDHGWPSEQKGDGDAHTTRVRSSQS